MSLEYTLVEIRFMIMIDCDTYYTLNSIYYFK